jgi:hypothetical protein
MRAVPVRKQQRRCCRLAGWVAALLACTPGGPASAQPPPAPLAVHLKPAVPLNPQPAGPASAQLPPEPVPIDLKSAAPPTARPAGIELDQMYVLKAEPEFFARDRVPVGIPSGDQPAQPAAHAPPQGVIQAGCSSCGGGGLEPPEGYGPQPGDCCDGNGCVPGRKTCYPCCATSWVGRFLCGLYECICCPDPCYEGHWVAAADAAFFLDAARPVTQMRFRWDAGYDMPYPDRAEFFQARAKVNQLEPTGPCTRHGFGKGPAWIASKVDHEDFSMYMEGATGRVGMFVETPYREIGPETAPSSPQPSCNVSGFADTIVGTKTLLLDCELVQFGLQFKTFLPTGNFIQGLGTGHVSLEPSALYTVKVTCSTYVQGQLAYWIPIGGDPLYEGNIYHSHLSVNQVLCKILPDVPLIGTLEFNEWSILGGNYTSPFLIADPTHPGSLRPIPISATGSIFSTGLGLRLVVCNKIDIGAAGALSLTGHHWEKEFLRVEFRWRF